ncbi:nucleotidyltransferase domain-containing protein [Pasteurella testudinis]|uniref:nucleotidyltransferase domain-containing protein n=1 Tax=Pasteurella testudinis TaxID=761 RepID=UPI004059C593
MIEPIMLEKIRHELKRIEAEENVVILYAIESGSRAWGFPSQDSDYDVRFIYSRTKEDYLSIDDPRDVLEYPINDLLDISGWDLKKALKLCRKGNPALAEWLYSPVVYQANSLFLNEFRQLADSYFSASSMIHHYLHMADGNFRGYLKSDLVKIKKYFYVLRPILACMWIEKYRCNPPILFVDLLNDPILAPELRRCIEALLARKLAGEEFDLELKIERINQFIEEKINYYQQYVHTLAKFDVPDNQMANALFRKWLKQ